MNKKISIFNSIILVIAMVIIRVISGMEKTYAEEKSEAIFSIEYKPVDRVQVLEKFLEKYNSPLKDSASTFVNVADKLNMDYRLLPAISCMESTCGKFLIEGTYNPFGWGIYGNNFIGFESYDEAIEVVGKGIEEGYISKGLDSVEKIAPVYTPPNPHGWRNGVTHFMNQMDEIALAI